MRLQSKHKRKTRAVKLALLAFVVALGGPAIALTYYSYQQLKWEGLHQQRKLAGELVNRIDSQLRDWIEQEEARSFTDYRFLVVSGDVDANFLQPSPLSAYPVERILPGALGYFQVDASGGFTSPGMPTSPREAEEYGISKQQFQERRELHNRIFQILHDNQLLRQEPAEERAIATADSSAPQEEDTVFEALAPEPAPEWEPVLRRQIEPDEPVAAQSPVVPDSDDSFRERKKLAVSAEAVRSSQQGFDQLLLEKEQLAQASNSIGGKTKESGAATGGTTRVEELADTKSEASAAAPMALTQPLRNARKERNVVPRRDALDEAMVATAPATTAGITLFESEVEPLEFSLLGSGHMVFFRKVWRDGERIIQGVLVDQDEFLRQAVLEQFRETLLAATASLRLSYRGETLLFSSRNSAPLYSVSGEQRLVGESLLQTSLSAPFNELTLHFSVTRLPVGPGGKVIIWTAVAMLLVLVVGTYLMYRLSVRQMSLAQQQHDFVSAVSHELKTPLTSIRMYGEMLRQGWADDSKRKQYYDYIFDESERLSRLITNVLQLARMNRNELSVQVRDVDVSELVDNLRSKLVNQVERAGFEFSLTCAKDLGEQSVAVDSDAFLQVIINLVDNGIKFSQKAERQRIEIDVRRNSNNEALFSVRDYGPGIGKSHLKKIFGLFYRGENELTRETVGTGIGLALVNQLVRAMGGRVDVVNREPGAEFRVLLNLKKV